MHNFNGYTDEDYSVNKLTAGATISIFVFVLAMVLGLLLG